MKKAPMKAAGFLRSALKRGPGKRKTVSFSANLKPVPRKPARKPTRQPAATKPARKPTRKPAAARKPALKRAARKPTRKAAPKRAARKPAARKPARRIDFSKIRWGTFTARFNSWKRRHPRAKVNTLREFAAYILTHPDKFSLRARRKALFYRNIILKGKVPMRIAKYHGRKSRTTATRKKSRTAAARKKSRTAAARKKSRTAAKPKRVRQVKRESSPRLLSPPAAHRPRKVRA
jgi:hypothetical protein